MVELRCTKMDSCQGLLTNEIIEVWHVGFDGSGVKAAGKRPIWPITVLIDSLSFLTSFILLQTLIQERQNLNKRVNVK